MNKRGTLMLLEQIIKLIVAVIVITLIIYAGVVLFRSYFGSQEELQAKGTLDDIIITLSETGEAETSELFIMAPSGWSIVAFDASHNKNADFYKPSIRQPNIVCLCKKKCKSEFCRVIDMPLKQEDKLANIKIRIMKLWINNQNTYYKIIKASDAKIQDSLSEENRLKGSLYTASSTELDKWLQEKESLLAGINECIIDASEQTGIPSQIILGIAIHESNWGKSNLAMECNNLYGIKQQGPEGICKMSTQEQEGDKFITIKAKFAKYKTQCQSVYHFVETISKSSYYVEAMEHTDDIEKMIYAIHGCSGPYAGQNCIYATDLEWANKVLEIIDEIEESEESKNV